jgi:hypothetical protein
MKLSYEECEDVFAENDINTTFNGFFEYVIKNILI